VKLRNTLALSQPELKTPHFTASGKVSDRRIKVQGYINETLLFVFYRCFGLDLLSALRFWCLSVENGMVCGMVAPLRLILRKNLIGQNICILLFQL
jgi:hypothetical protein